MRSVTLIIQRTRGDDIAKRTKKKRKQRTGSPQLLDQTVMRKVAGKLKEVVYHYAIFNGDRIPFGKVKAQADVEFDEYLARWLVNGRQSLEDDTEEAGELTVQVMCDRYKAHLSHKKGADYLTGSGNRVVYGLRNLCEFYGSTPAAGFDPLMLQTVQRALIERGKICRGEINHQLKKIKNAFSWAASQKLIDPAVSHGVDTVESLDEDDFGSHDNPRRKDVDMAVVEATLDYIPHPLDDVIRLIWETGARPAEILGLRPQDIDQSRKDGVWVASLTKHKTAWKGKARYLAFMSEAQKILAKFLLRPADRPLFSPAEGMAEMRRGKRAKREEPRPSDEARYERQREASPGETFNDAYESKTLSRAISRAITAANRDRRADGLDPLPRWTPYQVRHSAGTEVEAKCGSDDARVFLGHEVGGVTGGYIHRDVERTVTVHKRRSAAS